MRRRRFLFFKMLTGKRQEARDEGQEVRALPRLTLLFSLLSGPAFFHRLQDSLRFGVHLQFVIDVADVGAHGVNADVELAGDEFVA